MPGPYGTVPAPTSTILLQMLISGLTGCTATTMSFFLRGLKSRKENRSMMTMSPDLMVGSMETPSALLTAMTFFSMTQQVVMTGMTRRQVIMFFSIAISCQQLFLIKVLYQSCAPSDLSTGLWYYPRVRQCSSINCSINRSIIISQAMFPSMFWIKYFFRVLHIGSIIVVCNAIITSKITGEIVKDHKTLYMFAGIIAIVSGFVNTFLLKPKEMGEKRKLWVGFHHIKLLTALVIFTPLVKLLPMSVSSRIDIQFYWMVTMLLLSPFARFYREHFVALEKEKRIKEIKDQDSA